MKNILTVRLNKTTFSAKESDGGRIKCSHFLKSVSTFIRDKGLVPKLPRQKSRICLKHMKSLNKLIVGFPVN